ncbi:MAG TPA: right-handed parallel beta-helix repeat-containing protein [Planctomycetota bacterium]
MNIFVIALQVVAVGDDLSAAVAKGGVVTLAPGKHRSGPLMLSSKVTLRAEKRATIDFEGKGGLYLKADGCVVENLEILNAQNFGVDVDASDCVLKGCAVFGSGGDAVKLSPGNWREKKYNRGAKILNCEIGKNKAFEGIDCVGQDDVLIADCKFIDTPGWGVYLKGGAARGVVERCVFERTGTLANNPAGGVCLGEHTGPDEVMTNKHGQPWECVDGVVRHCVFIDIPSAALAAWCAKNSLFAHNTIVSAATKDRAAIIVLSNHGLPSTDLTFEGNIIVGAPGRPLVWLYDKGAAGKIVFKDNVWWGGNGKFWNQAAGRGPEDFAAWKAVDPTSVFADPKLDAAHRPGLATRAGATLSK